MIRITTAAATIRDLWPTFIESGGAVLLQSVPTPQLGDFSTLTEAEAFHSHTHMLDLFAHQIPPVHDDEFDLDKPDPHHPEHRLSWETACSIAEMWSAKLHRDFPGYRFRVYATRYDDPIVRFHRVRPGEPVWLEDPTEQRADADLDLVVFDTAPSQGRQPETK